MQSRRILWLFFAEQSDPQVPLAIPTVAWMAKAAKAEFEVYLESPRTGTLFAEHGSTVIGGHHHQQFNYLCASFDVKAIVLGKATVFASSLNAFSIPTIASGDRLEEVYARLLARPDVPAPEAVVFGPAGAVKCGAGAIHLAPYAFPEVYFRKALGFPAASAAAVRKASGRLKAGRRPVLGLYLDPAGRRGVSRAFPRVRELDTAGTADDFGSLTLRIARRWRAQARGVVFADPPAVLSQLASHCRHDRVAVYAPAGALRPADVKVSAYTEATSPIADEAARLALEVGNPVLTGRQTGDGDIFKWSERGVCIQIVDPNRPAFPAVETVRHPWAPPAVGPFDREPDEAQLEAWAAEGKVLTTLLWHSGEVAHNEAMLALVELAGWAGAKMGIGVHAARYETCPQLWELLNVPRERGGACGLIEPVLHSGGRGVLAECNCPPERLRDHCEASLRRIVEIAGAAAAPRGYYAFMDSNLDRLDMVRPDLFAAIAACGLEYVVSSARPGRNRLLWSSTDLGCVALNQSPRVVHGASPFVRVTTAEDLTTSSSVRPGWLVATLDAPVISFSPYIWRHGARFMSLVEALNRGNRINVTPRTVSRYARLLARRGDLPAGEPAV